MYHSILWAAVGTGITFLMTALGSATVLFVRGRTTPTLQRVFLGFAAGVMVAEPRAVIRKVMPVPTAAHKIE